MNIKELIRESLGLNESKTRKLFKITANFSGEVKYLPEYITLNLAGSKNSRQVHKFIEGLSDDLRALDAFDDMFSNGGYNIQKMIDNAHISFEDENGREFEKVADLKNAQVINYEWGNSVKDILKTLRFDVSKL